MDIKPDIEMQYAPQGIFFPLNGLIDRYGVNLQKVFDEKPYIRKLITNPDGSIYALPGVSENTNNALKYRCHINKAWLDRVGMNVPTTTDELYDVLKAFKSRDPNGNGSADEIPLAGAKTTKRESLPQVWLMAPFILNSPTNHMVVENGEVRLAAVQPEYREGLRWIHKLHDEGLLDGESFTRDSDQLKQLASKDGEEILGCAVCKSYYMIMDRNSERAKHWLYVPPLVGPNGDQHVWHNTSSLFRGKFAVTDKCRHPEVALRWADWMYSEEGTTKAFYGFEEGVNWYRPPAGTPSKSGDGDAKYARPSGWTVPELYSTLLGNNGLFYLTEEYTGSWEADPNDTVRLRLNEALYQAYKPAADKDNQSILPAMYLSIEETNEIGLLQTPINAYIDQSFARFVTGDLDINEDWDEYVKNLEKMNIRRLVEIYQKNLDIFNRG
jgi:putative aldouronate transport system substrate-binding protein